MPILANRDLIIAFFKAFLKHITAGTCFYRLHISKTCTGVIHMVVHTSTNTIILFSFPLHLANCAKTGWHANICVTMLPLRLYQQSLFPNLCRVMLNMMRIQIIMSKTNLSLKHSDIRFICTRTHSCTLTHQTKTEKVNQAKQQAITDNKL